MCSDGVVPHENHNGCPRAPLEQSSKVLFFLLRFYRFQMECFRPSFYKPLLGAKHSLCAINRKERFPLREQFLSVFMKQSGVLFFFFTLSTEWFVICTYLTNNFPDKCLLEALLLLIFSSSRTLK